MYYYWSPQVPHILILKCIGLWRHSWCTFSKSSVRICPFVLLSCHWRKKRKILSISAFNSPVYPWQWYATMLVSLLLSREKEESVDSYSKPVSQEFPVQHPLFNKAMSNWLSDKWSCWTAVYELLLAFKSLSIHYVKVELGDTILTIASLTCLGPAAYVLRTW